MSVAKKMKVSPEYENKLDEMRDPDGPPQFDCGGWITTAPFERLCGMEIIEAQNGTAVLRMPFTVKLSMCAGLMHGGAIASIADTAVAVAIKSYLPEDSLFVTAGMTTNFTAPVARGTIEAHARIDNHEGKKIIASAEVLDENSSLVCTFESCFIILREGPESS